MAPAALDALRIELDAVGQASLALALFLILLGIAMGLRVRDFRAVMRMPKPFLGGLVAQVVGLPLLTLALINVLQPLPSVALGMLVVACCPGGTTSNLFTYLARGNVAFSVSLTASSSLIAALATPISILFWSGTYAPTADLLASIGFDAVRFLLQTLLLLGLPLAIGMSTAAYFPGVASKLSRPMVTIGSLFLIVAVVYGLYLFRETLLPVAANLGGIIILHNAAAFALGALSGVVLTADNASRRALTFELGIQNTGLALVILVAQMRGLGGAMAVAALWGIWHLVAGFLVASLFRASDSRTQSG